jgi:3alpha(or 20beta)-hydroxysteroid dehydrogenase
MNRLSGKVALVSGAARGIGGAIAQAIVEADGKVVIGDLLDDEGLGLAEKLGPSASYVHLDVTSPDDWNGAVAAAVETYGELSVLVNNAGIGTFAPIDRFSHADWDRIVAVNLTGAFNGIQAGVPAMKNAGRGSIVNISSICGLIAVPEHAAYVATKFGIRGLTKVAALDLGKYGIRVNSVHPGFISTPLTAAVPPDTSAIPLGRPGHPDDVATLVVFLASDESSFSTDSEFVVDGGETSGEATGGSLSAALGPHGFVATGA